MKNRNNQCSSVQTVEKMMFPYCVETDHPFKKVFCLEDQTFLVDKENCVYTMQKESIKQIFSKEEEEVCDLIGEKDFFILLTKNMKTEKNSIYCWGKNNTRYFRQIRSSDTFTQIKMKEVMEGYNKISFSFKQEKASKSQNLPSPISFEDTGLCVHDYLDSFRDNLDYPENNKVQYFPNKKVKYFINKKEDLKKNKEENIPFITLDKEYLKSEDLFFVLKTENEANASYIPSFFFSYYDSNFLNLIQVSFGNDPICDLPQIKQKHIEYLNYFLKNSKIWRNMENESKTCLFFERFFTVLHQNFSPNFCDLFADTLLTINTGRIELFRKIMERFYEIFTIDTDIIEQIFFENYYIFRSGFLKVFHDIHMLLFHKENHGIDENSFRFYVKIFFFFI